MTPLISIVIPTYNKSEIISKSILSVKNQTWKNIEIIIVNDASTDQTSIILDKIKKIQVIENDINKGVAESRKVGITQAKGDFICFLDDDDCWDPTHIESLFASMNKEQSDVVFSNYKMNINGVMSEFKMDFFSNNFYEKILLRPGPFIQSCIFKTSIFEDKNLFDSNSIPSEDWDLFITLAKKKLSISYSNHCGFIWNFSKKSQSSNLKNEARAIEYIINKNKETILNVHGKNTLSDHYRRIARIYEKNKNYKIAKNKYNEAYLVSKYYYKNIFYKFLLLVDIGYNYKVINLFRFLFR